MKPWSLLALAMLGGEQSFTSGGYYGTPVAAALPVELYGPFDSGPILDTQKFSPVLTTAGQQHPVTSLRYSGTDNLAAWKALPPLEGVNLVAAAKTDAMINPIGVATVKPRFGWSRRTPGVASACSPRNPAVDRKASEMRVSRASRWRPAATFVT